jgi:4-amino-4-deoxy-L-arabinose transferase-like glycosyltransferase
MELAMTTEEPTPQSARFRWPLSALIAAVLLPLIGLGFEPAVHPSPGKGSGIVLALAALPVCACFLASETRLPSWLIGLYGLVGASWVAVIACHTRPRFPPPADESTIGIVAAWILVVLFVWGLCRRIGTREEPGNGGAQ